MSKGFQKGNQFGKENKGRSAWNKDKHYEGIPWDRKKKGKKHPKMSEAAKNSYKRGRIVWNKDKKSLQVAWNKNKKGLYHCSKESKIKRSKESRGENNPMFGKKQSTETKMLIGTKNYKNGSLYKNSLEYKENLAKRKRPKQCEICGGLGKICFDHDHSKGEKTKESFRGWICTRCNITLGYTKDSPELLRRLADYLENYSNRRLIDLDTLEKQERTRDSSKTQL